MAERTANNQPEDVSVDWAYAVIDVVVKAEEKVITKPGTTRDFLVDLQKNFPDIADAVMAITVPEHRQMMAKLLRTTAKVNAVWLQNLKI